MSKPIAAKEIGQLLDEHSASLELYAAQWTLVAEDCVQEAFIELATQAVRPEVPVAWLYRVVRNRALNANRSARRRANHERLAAILRQSPAIVSNPVDQEDGFLVALDLLSSEERELIVLRIWSGITWQQIAELAGTSSSSASAAMWRLLVYRMNDPPAAEPNPALKYRLTVQPHKTIPGNAITHYLRSYGENSLNSPWKDATDKFGQEVYDWYGNEIPIKNLPLEKLREVCGYFDVYVDNHIARATRCRVVDWGLAEEDLSGMEMVEFLLPSVQQTRSISRMLAIRTRLAIAEGRYVDAVDLLRMNYQLGQNVSKIDFLVAGLVGIAEIGMAHQSIIDLIAAKTSPNMYWALAELPRPIINLRDSMRLEVSIGTRLVPELRDVDTADHSAQEWERILKKTINAMNSVGVMVGTSSATSSKIPTVAIALASYPDAKSRLMQNGINRQQVEAMSVAQVLVIDTVNDYRDIAEDFEKSIYVPYRDSKSIISNAEEASWRRDGQVRLGAILADALLPAISQVRNAQIRIEWQRNALQVIEALRLHAAATGSLPKSLNEITMVPVPINPATEKPYSYRLDGETAVLEMPFSDGMPGMAQRFEVQIDK